MGLPDNVELFPGATDRNFEPNVILQAATRSDLESVVILGWGKDGSLFISGSISNMPEWLWLIEQAKKQMLEDGTVES